ncbi:hypothetical protein ISN44_As11g036450 [Arabidopsis suecica]|uniref:Uncharacterized protein n=1 Tax=Arabidopsis suecica TaxID=45249 RepID=A0A8T1ZEM8_ARASU|nr:hypothetical protein ISN44_As11g036450 [Arabidopsis suecica]
MTGVKDPTRFVMIERLPSLSMFNPESDSKLDRDFPVMSENDPTRFMRIKRLPSSSIKPKFYLGFGSELDNYFPVMDVKDPIRFRRIEIFPSLSIIRPKFYLDSGSQLDNDFPVLDDWSSPEKVRLEWENEEGEGLIHLIEIKLDE